MIKRLARSGRIFVAAAVAIACVSTLAWGLLSLGGGSSGGVGPRGEPAVLRWSPTGQFQTENLGVTVSLLSFWSDGKSTGVLYTTVHSVPALTASPRAVAITDDTGAAYRLLNHTVVGSALGVTVGEVNVEPYKRGGRTLTLSIDGIDVRGGGAPQILSGVWPVKFIENTDPDTPLSGQEVHVFGDGVVRAGDATMWWVPLSGPVLKVLVDRSATQSAVYGVSLDGVPRGATEAEFQQVLQARGISDLPPPANFPLPVGASPTPKTALTEPEAMFAAGEAASHLIRGHGVQDMRIELLTYSETLARLAERGVSTPAGDQQPAEGAFVWLVSFIGTFAQPAPGGALTNDLVCNEILVLVDDAAGKEIQLSVTPLDPCPSPPQFPGQTQPGN